MAHINFVPTVTRLPRRAWGRRLALLLLERRVKAFQEAAVAEVCPSLILTVIIIYFRSSRK